MNIIKSIPVLLTIFLASCSGINQSIDPNLSRSYNLTSSQVEFTQPIFPYEPGQYRFDTFITKIVFGGDESSDYIEFYVHNHHLMNTIKFQLDDNASSVVSATIFPEVNGTYRMYMSVHPVTNTESYLFSNRDILARNRGTYIKMIVEGLQTQEYFLDNFH